jgi:L-lactate dehydrogenase complex protein LldG
MLHQSNQSKAMLLDKIAQKRTFPKATDSSSNTASSFFKAIEIDPVLCFKNELEAVNGKVFICSDSEDLYQQISDFLEPYRDQNIYCQYKDVAFELKKRSGLITCNDIITDSVQIGIVKSICNVARTGSVVVSAHSGRQANIFPPIQLIIARKADLVNFMEDAFDFLSQQYAQQIPSTITFITGPSRTADIEKTLVMGAHGPKELYVFITNNDI